MTLDSTLLSGKTRVESRRAHSDVDSLSRDSRVENDGPSKFVSWEYRMMRRESKVGFLVDFGEPKARLSVSGLDFVNPLLNQISALDSRLSTLGSRLSKLSELSSKPWGG